MTRSTSGSARLWTTDNEERHHTRSVGIVQLPLGSKCADSVVRFGTPLRSEIGLRCAGTWERFSRPIIVPTTLPTNYVAFDASAGKEAAAAFRLAWLAGQCHQVGYDTLRGDPFFNLICASPRTFVSSRLESPTHHSNAFNLTNKTNYG